MSNIHTDKSLEQAALRLQPRDRARLAHSLVESLGGLSREELTALWLDEAERRDEEMASGRLQGIPGEKVFARIESRYRK